MRKGTSGFTWLVLMLVIVLLVLGGSYVYLKHLNQKPFPYTSSYHPPLPYNTKTKQKDSIDLTKLPLGDGKVTAAGPKKGYVYSCTDNFRGGGAQHSGGWIASDTWDLKEKPTVDGSVSWPNADKSIISQGNWRVITGNGLPLDTVTGIFPIRSGSTAYQYDRNPNSIQSQSINIRVPLNPTAAATPNCLGLGPIGYMFNGVALFDALDAAGRDAAAHEIQDKCAGHPQQAGVYHYHSMSDCIPGEDVNNQAIGYALDGYGIFSDRDANGKQYTSADLDACHGITSQILWDGKLVSMYHYVLTRDYPYSLGCYHGTPVRTPPQ